MAHPQQKEKLPVFTIGETAGMWKPRPVSSAWVRKLVATGELPGFRSAGGTQWLVREPDVRDYLARRARKAAEAGNANVEY